MLCEKKGKLKYFNFLAWFRLQMAVKEQEESEFSPTFLYITLSACFFRVSFQSERTDMVNVYCKLNVFTLSSKNKLLLITKIVLFVLSFF